MQTLKRKPRKKETRKRRRFKLEGYMSLIDIYKSGEVYWVSSKQTIASYLDIYSHILKPVRFGKKDSGRVVYVAKNNLEKFIRMYEHNEIKKHAKRKTILRPSEQPTNVPVEVSAIFSGEEKYLNILDVYKSKKLFWLKTYGAVRQYIKNPKYRQILRPFRFGKRKHPNQNPQKQGLCVSEKNLDRFITMFLKGDI